MTDSGHARNSVALFGATLLALVGIGMYLQVPTMAMNPMAYELLPMVVGIVLVVVGALLNRPNRDPR